MVKQFGVNMQEQVIVVLKPFLDFMDSFKFYKAHNMLAFMLDPWFKDLSLVGDCVGHFLTIEISCACNSQFLLPTFKNLYQKLHGRSNSFTNVVQKKMCNTNVVFGIGMSKSETCLKQVLFFFTYLKDLYFF